MPRSSSWRPCASASLSADAAHCSTSTGRIDAAIQRSIFGRNTSRRSRGERRMLLRDLGRLTPSSSSSLSSSTSSSVSLAPPRSFGGSSDPSEGLADAAEDLLRALRAEPDGGGTRSGGGGGGGGGRAARRADELAADGMWPLYRALGDVADLLDLADRGGGGNRGEFGEESSSSSSSSADADAEALSLLRSHPSLLLLPRSELARRLVLLKAAAGPGADAAALARKLPWLLSHADPGEVLRRTLQQMLALMPGVGGGAELRSRLFGSSSSERVKGVGGRSSGGRQRRSSDGRASQSWLTFADIARGVSRKLKVEEREKEQEGR